MKAEIRPALLGGGYENETITKLEKDINAASGHEMGAN